MDYLKSCSELFFFGAKDCICGPLAFRRILNRGNNQQQRTTRSNNAPNTVSEVFSKCLKFGTSIGLSIFLYPLIVTGFSDLLTSYLCPGEEFVWLSHITSILFCVFWKMPMFMFGRILTYTWFQNIADITCRDIGLKKRATRSWGVEFPEQILSLCVQSLFLCQGLIILKVACMYQGIIYYLGYCVFIFHLALLYSLYAFEYKWYHKGWSLSRRTAFVEGKWPYFVGFGLPLAVLTSCFDPYVGSMCFFTIFFPIIMVTSTVTFNEKVNNFQKPRPQVFFVVTWIGNNIISRLINLFFVPNFSFKLVFLFTSIFLISILLFLLC